MATNIAPRVQAIVLLLLVATAGAVAGIVGDRLVSERADPSPAVEEARPGPGAGPWRWEARRDMRYGERLSSDLDLSPAQRAAIDSIVRDQQQRVRSLTAEVEPQFRAIAEQTRGRVEAVLTPEQRARLAELRDERRRTMREEWRPGRDRVGPREERMRLRRSDTLP
ncbi:MAG TPA: hypothetical protein VK936_15555 [Longimicrobiales bacterium]|nr:hypothetical protein [Longimicrobiales bacterium]